MEHQIRYEINPDVTAEQVAGVFALSGIRRPVDDLPRIEAMLRHANLSVGAYDGDMLVGFGRALTDFSFCCYLSDLAVDLKYQRRGIGKRIVELVHERIGPQSMLLLLAAPAAMEYYPKIGFEKAENAWIIYRSS